MERLCLLLEYYWSSLIRKSAQNRVNARMCKLCPQRGDAAPTTISSTSSTTINVQSGGRKRTSTHMHRANVITPACAYRRKLGIGHRVSASFAMSDEIRQKGLLVCGLGCHMWCSTSAQCPLMCKKLLSPLSSFCSPVSGT